MDVKLGYTELPLTSSAHQQFKILLPIRLEEFVSLIDNGVSWKRLVIETNE